MKTEFHTNPDIAAAFISYCNSLPSVSRVLPERFLKLMETNTGSVGALTPYGLDENGLERRNPLVVVLGDSVTAGHFESTTYADNMIKAGRIPGPADTAYPQGIQDVLTSYPDRFRKKLVELYSITAVNVLNAGIAGDTLIGMDARLQRDVISFQPDLVIINGTLNWTEQMGSSEIFKEKLAAIVDRIKDNTNADIILLTPNMNDAEKISRLTGRRDTLCDRVEMVRQVAEEKMLCLADAYRVWEGFVAQGYKVGELLANGFHHPSEAGHEVFALELMKLFPKQVHDAKWNQEAASPCKK